MFTQCWQQLAKHQQNFPGVTLRVFAHRDVLTCRRRRQRNMLTWNIWQLFQSLTSPFFVLLIVFFSVGEAVLSFGAGKGRGMKEAAEACFSSIAKVQHQPSGANTNRKITTECNEGVVGWGQPLLVAAARAMYCTRVATLHCYALQLSTRSVPLLSCVSVCSFCPLFTEQVVPWHAYQMEACAYWPYWKENLSISTYFL